MAQQPEKTYTAQEAKTAITLAMVSGLNETAKQFGKSPDAPELKKIRDLIIMGTMLIPMRGKYTEADLQAALEKTFSAGLQKAKDLNLGEQQIALFREIAKTPGATLSEVLRLFEVEGDFMPLVKRLGMEKEFSKIQQSPAPTDTPQPSTEPNPLSSVLKSLGNITQNSWNEAGTTTETTKTAQMPQGFTTSSPFMSIRDFFVQMIYFLTNLFGGSAVVQQTETTVTPAPSAPECTSPQCDLKPTPTPTPTTQSNADRVR